MRKTFLILPWMLTLCICVGVFNCFAQFPPDGPGKDVFENVCTLCHSTTAIVGKQWTKSQWESKVTEMLQEESVSVQERAAIVEYLSANFKPGGRIYINKAAAKDLATALEISTKDGEAIVHYREDNGVFKSLDDLKKVPGVDVAKLETKRDRLEFQP